MILLDTTTRSLEFKLSGAVTTNQLPFVASYVDIETSGFGVTGVSSNNGVSNGTTAVPLVAAPAAATTRQVKFISIPNSDTVSATVIVQYNDNATLREIGKWTLAVNDTLQFIDSVGFSVIDGNGSIKQGVGSTNHTNLSNLDYASSGHTGFLAQDGSAAYLTSFPTLNQDTTGKSAKTDALNSATTIVNVAAATAPTTGQVLTAISDTAATWQTPSGGGGGNEGYAFFMGV